MAVEDTYKYEIKDKDTFWRIAQDCGLSVAELHLLNPQITDVSLIYPEQVLNLPVPAEVSAPEVVALSDAFSGSAGTLVASGHNVPNPNLGADEVSSGLVYVDWGQEALGFDQRMFELGFFLGGEPVKNVGVPEEGDPVVSRVAVERYMVKGGDTFSEIAEKLGFTQAALEAANPGENIELIRVGQVLNLPTDAEVQVAIRVSEAEDLNRAVSMAMNMDAAEILVSISSADFSSSGFVPKAEVEEAFRRVEGKPVQAHFQNASFDERPLVLIDLGHHAYTEYYENKEGEMVRDLDKGAVSASGLTEVDVVDPVALAFANRMVAMGHRVAFTRGPGEIYRYSADDDVGHLGSRALYGHELEDMLNAPFTTFVSFHANGHKEEASHGMEVLIAGSGGTALNPESQALAELVLDGMDGYGEVRNRGLKFRDDLAVLNVAEKGDMGAGQQPDAAILVEFPFLTNLDDEKVLQHMAKNPQEIADRIAGGVDSYLQARALSERTFTADNSVGAPLNEPKT